MQQGIVSTEGGGFVASGPVAVSIVRAMIIRRALLFYAKTKMQVNRAYTPKAMLDAAAGITGLKFKRGQYVVAADALKLWADAVHKGECPHCGRDNAEYGGVCTSDDCPAPKVQA